MSKNDESGYSKIGAKIIGYRYGIGDDRGASGYFRATLQLRRMVSADIVREIAERLRTGGDAGWKQRLLDKIRDSGSRNGRYFEYDGSVRDEIIELAWQANRNDVMSGDPIEDPEWYGIRCESAGITRWSASILRKVADIEGDQLYVTPRQIIEALDANRVQYVDSGVWTYNNDPDYTPRQLQFVNREAPESTESFATQCLDDPQAHESAPLGSVGVA